jgi:hypothetical protein
MQQRQQRRQHQEEQKVSQQLNEDLKENDLRNLVDNIFEVDSYASKMGSDKDIVVLSFNVESREPSDDLVNFLERGYDFVLDADTTPGELNDGRYKVFVEIERTRKIGQQIMEILDGVGKLTGIDDFKYRYYKSFHSIPADESSLTETIPVNSNEYDQRIQESKMNNFSNFFNRSYLESISIDEDDIVFQKKYAEPLRMRIKSSGPRSEIYNDIEGRMMIESRDIAEILFMTKFIGDYNITKIGNKFVFENEKYAVVLEKI